MEAHGSAEWFRMVGALMCEAAREATLPPSLHVSLVERFLDGAALPGGQVAGLRFDIVDGRPAFRIGVGPDETGDITIEVTAAASRTLNTLYGADPRFGAEVTRLQKAGALRIAGDLGLLGSWFDAVHDRIVARTA